MNCDTFRSHLQIASRHCAEVTRAMVVNVLPEQFLYLVRPNQSYDGNQLHLDEVVYPHGTPEKERLRDEAEVVEYLWRDGKVPEWINIITKRVTPEYTIFLLECCGRFSANEDFLYFTEGDCPPFGVKGSYLPRGWKSVEENGRFDFMNRNP